MLSRTLKMTFKKKQIIYTKVTLKRELREYKFIINDSIVFFNKNFLFVGFLTCAHGAQVSIILKYKIVSTRTAFVNKVKFVLFEK